MPGIEKLHLEDALEDAPQTRSLLGVFQKDAKILRKYTATMQQLSQRMLGAQREMCSATQALSAHLKSYPKQNFPLETDDSILTATLQQFADYLDDLSSMHQVLATQMGDGMMYPINKFLQADLDAEVLTMGEMYQISSNDHESAIQRYMKFSKKKEMDQKVRHEANDDLYVYRRKFHQTALHLFSSLNALQYKRKMALLEPLIGYIEAQRTFFTIGKDAMNKTDVGDFMGNMSASIQGVQAEMNAETKKTVELMDNIEKSSSHLYHADPPPEMPFIPPNLTLSQKAGYLHLRSKVALISTKWERCYFFIQGGNLMCQQREEVAGSLVLDLNLEGTHAEPADIDDRRHAFHVISPKLKRTVVLQAENARERDEWVATINNVVLEGGYVQANQPKKRVSFSTPTQNTGAAATGAESLRPPTTLNTVVPAPTSPTSPAARPPSNHHPAASPTSPTNQSADSGFFPDAPISFDIVPSSNLHKSLLPSVAKDGPPKRINPFDEASGAVASQHVTDNSAFCQTFDVRFLGSMEVKGDRGEQLVTETIRQIMAARAIHNVFKMAESVLMISSQAMRLIDPASNAVRTEFALEDISFWAVHTENKRLFGFITRNRSSDDGGKTSFACHVFECNTTGEEICQAIHQATKLAFEVLMRKREVEKQKYIEQQILLNNIQNLAEMSGEEKAAAQRELDEKDAAIRAVQAAVEAETAANTAVDEAPDIAVDEAPEGTPDTTTSKPRLSIDGQYLILDNQSESGPEKSSQSPASPQSPDSPAPITARQSEEGAEPEEEPEESEA